MQRPKPRARFRPQSHAAATSQARKPDLHEHRRRAALVCAQVLRAAVQIGERHGADVDSQIVIEGSEEFAELDRPLDAVSRKKYDRKIRRHVFSGAGIPGMPALVRVIPPVVMLMAACCMGQDPEPSRESSGSEKEAAAKFRAYGKEIATAYELRSGDSARRKLTLVAKPVLRWTNPLGGQRARGEIYLWTDSGLPAAIVSINEFTDTAGRIHGEQEWCSLAAGPIVADGPHRWSPAAGVLTPQPLRDV